MVAGSWNYLSTHRTWSLQKMGKREKSKSRLATSATWKTQQDRQLCHVVFKDRKQTTAAVSAMKSISAHTKLHVFSG